MKRTPITHADLARIDAVEATAWPARITRALEVLRVAGKDAGGSGGGPTGKNTISDPTGRAAVADLDDDLDPIVRRARRDKATLVRALIQRSAQARRIARILDEWAPPAGMVAAAGDAENVTFWCQNHRRHEAFVPRAVRPDGKPNGIHCRWCADILRNYGLLPTRALVRMHDQGRRIDDTTYRRELGVKAP